MSRLSFRARLTASFGAGLLLVLAVAGLFVHARVDNELTGAIDDTLDARAADAARAARASPDGRRLNSALFESDEGFAQLLDEEGKVVASTLAPRTGPAVERSLVGRALKGRVRLEGREVAGVEAEARILAYSVPSRGGDRLVIVAGASTDDREEALTEITAAFVAGIPLAVLLAVLLGYGLARRSLAPVEAMRRKAAGITLEHSGERLPLPLPDDELRRLGVTLNDMLDRIEALLVRERAFVADASHELRTPLAVLKTELELADRPGRTSEELAAAVMSAAQEVDRLQRLADDLLLMARFDEGKLELGRETVDVSELLVRVAGRFAGQAATQGRELVSAPAAFSAEIDVLRTEQALSNLVANALEHGAGTVTLAARREGDRAVFEVADEGTGFEAGFAEDAFERFTRARERRAAPSGSGLGLAIVRAIAQAHGGDVVVAASAPAPTVVRMWLAGSA